MVLGLSFNLLLGQTGLLSFGHAVFSGLGAFAAIHTLNRFGPSYGIFTALGLPLVSGLAGLSFGILVALISSKRSGLTFSMLSMAIGELLFVGAPVFPEIFGGEAGISGDRGLGVTCVHQSLFIPDSRSWCLSFGPTIEVSYLILVWTLLSTGAMFFLTRSPLGLLAKAARDNPERLAFLSYDPRVVRFLMICLSSFFAGLAGGLSALHFEIATEEAFSPLRSAAILLFVYIGGVNFFWGPIFGAILAVMMSVYLSEITPAWQFYLGLLFICTVILMPEGLLAGIGRRCQHALASWEEARSTQNTKAYLTRFAIKMCAFTLSIVGLLCLIELSYRWRHPIETNNLDTLFRSFSESKFIIASTFGAISTACGIWLLIRLNKTKIRQC
ncbi:branched-chain amino acid ABC transporter permease [Undibacterium sp. FT137W]|uniref:Branched-chain amino acid ABC transporter permease n=2 Tax=Undibacterium fentianense TaxID=2828728 RepID=A0A941IC77_9BURK|nr:branched-chain amino acid ABC transporter permease [Undibacterium fentianense]